MIPDDSSIMLFKFGEYRWLNKLKEGEVSFGCPGRYIDIAKKGNNDEQGDIDEGIFARLKKGDKKIEEMANSLKEDLEIMDDGTHVKLRRKSSYRVPVFCFYTLTARDMLTKVHDVGLQNVIHNFDPRIFSSFAPSEMAMNVLQRDFLFSTLYIKPKPFLYFFAEAMIHKNIKYSMNSINYTEFEKDEFFINPTSKREELFYKSPRYKYQSELRICLHDVYVQDIYDRYNISIRRLPDEYAYLFEKTKIQINMTLDIARRQKNNAFH